MIADTKAVREVLKSFNIRAFTTDKSQGNITDKSVRIVVAVTTKKKFLEVKQAFLDLGYTNKVYFTGDVGRPYLRVKTFLA